jgi:hypothetical protein
MINRFTKLTVALGMALGMASQAHAIAFAGDYTYLGSISVPGSRTFDNVFDTTQGYGDPFEVGPLSDYYVFFLATGANTAASATFTLASSITNFSGAIYATTGTASCAGQGTVCSGLSISGPALATATGVLNGTASQWSIAGTFLNNAYYILEVAGTVGQTADNGTSYSGTIATSVPAPAALGLLGIGLVGMGLTRRRNGPETADGVQTATAAV